MAGTMSISGLISGLKTDDIISKIMEIAKRPQTKMQADKIDAQTRMATWQDLNMRVLALKTRVDTIAVSGAFSNCQATSSDLSIVQATAGTNATPGTYYLTVKSRAQSHQIAALCQGTPPEPFTSTTADVGTGDVSFAFDDPNKSFEVTIDGSNNTLAGLRDAVNRANKGVQASIINSGTASSPAYQLVLSSTTTGEASQFTVSADPTIKVDFSTVIQQGGDAEVQLGAGGEGTSPITITKDTNTITDLIPGVTLNIVNPDETKTIKIEVARNISVIKSSIQSFVDQYNDLSDAISVQFAFDTKTNTSGALMGDWNLQSVQMTLSSIVGGVVNGVDKRFCALAAIGITQDTQGHLQIDDTALTNAVNDNLSDVGRLFASDLRSGSSYVSYLSSTADTQPSGATGWNVNITQAARQAQVTAAVAMTGTLGADETLTIYADPSKAKTTQAISLSSGWSLDRVIAEINSYSDDTGVCAVGTKADGTVSLDPDENTHLTLRSARYGSGAKVYAYSSLSNGVANTTGLGNKLVSADDAGGETGTGVGLAGLDVAGTINGQACKGAGQMLMANPASSSSAVKGLWLLITSAAPLSTTVYFTKGIGTSLRDTLINMSSLTGIVTTAQDSINQEISDLDDSIAEMQTRLDYAEQKLYDQFNALESQLARLQDQGNFLTQQLAALNNSSY